jgi:hypothetical protein
MIILAIILVLVIYKTGVGIQVVLLLFFQLKVSIYNLKTKPELVMVIEVVGMLVLDNLPIININKLI